MYWVVLCEKLNFSPIFWVPRQAACVRKVLDFTSHFSFPPEHPHQTDAIDNLAIKPSFSVAQSSEKL